MDKVQYKRYMALFNKRVSLSERFKQLPLPRTESEALIFDKIKLIVDEAIDRGYSTTVDVASFETLHEEYINERFNKTL